MQTQTHKGSGCVTKIFVFAALWACVIPSIVRAQSDKTTKKSASEPYVEVRITDGSLIKVVLRDEHIEMKTTFGKLKFPVAEIRRIQFSFRVSEQTRKQIDKAIADLGSSSYRLRESATATLLRLRERAYPALMAASKGKNAESASRAKKLLAKIRESVPKEDLELPPHDIVYTKNSKFVGRINLATFNVHTLAFGNQQLDLHNMRFLRSLSAVDEEQEFDVRNALPDPGRMTLYAMQAGKTFTFRITAPTAAVASQMGVYGTDVYTTDSHLAASAVHAGVIEPGKTGYVRVTVVGQHAAFPPSTQNGVISRNWSSWTGFRFEKKKR